MPARHARTASGARPSPRESADDVERIVDALTRRTGQRPGAVRNVVQDLVRGRDQRELAEMQIRRGIYRLADLGASQRDIARLVGLSQPEVSRRLRRRGPAPSSESPREVVLRRAAGQMNTQEMVEKLSTMPLTAKVPGRSGAYDGAASVRGTAKQLMAAFQDGLLTEEEYEAVRSTRASRSRRSGRPAVPDDR